ncbi:MAG: hypothetical protein JXR83_02440 [Deltaproteobacteria bacterium]|nr:hypothetical protein [Deltaproteobacteria bacterium]
MNEKLMRESVEKVLEQLDAEELEKRIAPVKCEKNPEAPECQIVALYAVRYGIGL